LIKAQPNHPAKSPGTGRYTAGCTMGSRPFQLIAFDGDDTLWHNERSYRDGRDRFRRLLASAGVDLSDEEVESRVNDTELANLEYFGYGVSSFTLSLIETAIQVTGGRISATDVGTLVAMAKEMMTEEVELFDGARETVAALSASYPLMLITKGDLLHQTSKLERSGLREYFSYVEVVSQKTARVYASILNRQHIDPGGFLMIGNSLRSDVLPVIEMGGWTVHIPAVLSWSHEDADEPEGEHGRYTQLASLVDVASFVESFEQSVRTR
jgi:putative hydrolase of the HAD superfamily